MIFSGNQIGGNVLRGRQPNMRSFRLKYQFRWKNSCPKGDLSASPRLVEKKETNAKPVHVQAKATLQLGRSCRQNS